MQWRRGTRRNDDHPPVIQLALRGLYDARPRLWALLATCSSGKSRGPAKPRSKGRSSRRRVILTIRRSRCLRGHLLRIDRPRRRRNLPCSRAEAARILAVFRSGCRADLGGGASASARQDPGRTRSNRSPSCRPRLSRPSRVTGVAAVHMETDPAVASRVEAVVRAGPARAARVRPGARDPAPLAQVSGPSHGSHDPRRLPRGNSGWCLRGVLQDRRVVRRPAPCIGPPGGSNPLPRESPRRLRRRARRARRVDRRWPRAAPASRGRITTRWPLFPQCPTPALPLSRAASAFEPKPEFAGLCYLRRGRIVVSSGGPRPRRLPGGGAVPGHGRPLGPPARPRGRAARGLCGSALARECSRGPAAVCVEREVYGQQLDRGPKGEVALPEGAPRLPPNAHYPPGKRQPPGGSAVSSQRAWRVVRADWMRGVQDGAADVDRHALASVRVCIAPVFHRIAPRGPVSRPTARSRTPVPSELDPVQREPPVAPRSGLRRPRRTAHDAPRHFGVFRRPMTRRSLAPSVSRKG